jgi:hypothetical protein
MAGFLACSCCPQTEPRKFCVVFVKQVSIILCGESLPHSLHKYSGYSSILLPQKRRTHVKIRHHPFFWIAPPPPTIFRHNKSIFLFNQFNWLCCN